MADPAEVLDDLESLLVDLAELPFETVSELPDSALGCALRRLHEAVRTPDRMFASQYQDSL
ncbi:MULTISPECIES: hypothetical protein [unclassified Streptomyces]|uniref:hypothetical protein n=1 Tax=unclassified Streptomyces TaxID=2593676 RepID=UPI00366430C5